MSEKPQIPIENIYYMFCYAWDRFEQARSTDVGAESSPDLPNLLARVLLAGVRHLMRRGLDRGYQPTTEDLATIRGRIAFNQSLTLQTQNIRRLVCEFDELSHDVLHNRIIKATMYRLARVTTLEPALAHQLRVASRTMTGISDIRLTRMEFGRVQLHRNNAYYDFLMRICQLAFDLMLPTANGSNYRFEDVLRDERKMAMVFESFVRNFYRSEQRHFRVSPLQFGWDATPLSAEHIVGLPQMRTDIFLQSQNRQIIIDTKYYADALQERFGSRSFRSGNLYQLFAYLKNAEALGFEYEAVEGMLLYPAVRDSINSSYHIQGHDIRIATINLDQDWRAIDADLKSLLIPLKDAVAARQTSRLSVAGDRT
ncbi:hypothetical protein ASD64_20025 [Mesorhizobium sp. Root157]|uniref:5-methylcytosine-specific restriction endonuclease system specificity protein McrC n=1 Tax=Mesorhizobium sp. Root157 TaxID=1736477 RepID=UPI0006FF6DB6|nr:5-methylcytosine-specific restriction endonuclease system specificity protein McrC [Mesorhizobium sp. Root157]KQZ87366.1 hypothetical protein ASD64_20025 [Mesorhizobium sp. Root157]